MTVNEQSSEKMKQFIAKQDAEFASFVRVTMDMAETDKFKCAVINHKIKSNREELNKFEKSLDWEDE